MRKLRVALVYNAYADAQESAEEDQSGSGR